MAIATASTSLKRLTSKEYLTSSQRRRRKNLTRNSFKEKMKVLGSINEHYFREEVPLSGLKNNQKHETII